MNVQSEIMEHISNNTIGILGTFHEDGRHPYLSICPYVFCFKNKTFLFHISQLAQHTKNILKNHHATILIEKNRQATDPLSEPRVSILGHINKVSDDQFDDYKNIYIETFPNSKQRFQFKDFMLMQLVPEIAHYIKGFGQIYSVNL